MVFICHLEKGLESKINEQPTPKQVFVVIVYGEGKVDLQLIERLEMSVLSSSCVVTSWPLYHSKMLSMLEVFVISIGRHVEVFIVKT